MQDKLTEAGLSKEQAEAVETLSKDVVAKVVAEVVPRLTEAILLEEIAKLKKG